MPHSCDLCEEAQEDAAAMLSVVLQASGERAQVDICPWCLNDLGVRSLTDPNVRPDMRVFRSLMVESAQRRIVAHEAI